MIRFFSNISRTAGNIKLASLVPVWFVFFLLIALAVFFFPEHALAAADESKEFKDFVKAAQNLLTIVLKTMQALFWPVLLMIGGLMDNELIFGGEMGEKLREIWVQIRNLVNIIFVLVLVVIAVYNVLGLGEQGPLQGLQLKQALPKFALALIVVNFSFLGAKVFLDFTNVLTTAVFSLPANLEQEFPKFREEFQNTVCQPDQPLRKGFCEDKKPEFSAKGRAYFSNLERSNVGLIMAVSFGKLADQQIVKGGIESLGQLTFNIIFGVVIYVIYASAFIALFAVLLARVVVLWVMVALSPLFALGIVLPQLATLGGEAGGNIGQKFMKHAISPLVIGLFLSIGYIMIGALNRARGAHDAYFSQIRLEDIDPNTLVTGIDDLHQMLASVAVAVLVWTGVFAAAKDTVAQGFTEGLKGIVGGFGKWTAKLPTYLQAIPVGGGEKISLAELGKTAEVIKGMPETATKPLVERRSPYEQVKKFTRSEHAQDLGKFVQEQEPGAIRYAMSDVKDSLKKVFHDNTNFTKQVDEADNYEKLIDALYDHSDVKNKLKLTETRQTFKDRVGRTAEKEASYVTSERLRKATSGTAAENTNNDLRDALKGTQGAVERLSGNLNLQTIARDPEVRKAYKDNLASLPEPAQQAFTFFNYGQEDAATPARVKARMDRARKLYDIINARTGDIDSDIENEEFSAPFLRALVEGKAITGKPKLEEYLRSRRALTEGS